ncbi:SAF domain-containing protein [Streptantibioticus parmotrematis]|uniref:SAF domain-containing protein n=1 Tax=Streptantibioticus parmotrematis TaxID=2873249 RepID=UPI0027DEF350|nr:SAF domain-containing protein [Streptantibioticus parmotrematis]
MSNTFSPPPAAVPAQGQPGAPASAPRLLKQRRRRPGLIALSVALIAGGGLAGALLYAASGHRSSVVVVVKDVPVGGQITADDLGQASIALDPRVKAVSASKERVLVGQRAAVDLKAGSLLSPSQVTRQSLMGPSQQLVGVSLKPSQLPASPLSPGEHVVIVSTPDPDTISGTGKPVAASGSTPTLDATVVAVGKPAVATGQITVDVAVDSVDGPSLAARVATGDVSLVVAAQDGN